MSKGQALKDLLERFKDGDERPNYCTLQWCYDIADLSQEILGFDVIGALLAKDDSSDPITKYYKRYLTGDETFLDLLKTMARHAGIDVEMVVNHNTVEELPNEDQD